MGPHFLRADQPLQVADMTAASDLFGAQQRIQEEYTSVQPAAKSPSRPSAFGG